MTNKVAIVTGAGSGIGRATAIGLGAVGYRLVLVGRRRDRLEETAGLLQAGTSLIVAEDVADWNAAAAVVRAAMDQFGRIDAVVNNAGLAPAALIGQTSEAMARDVLAVNTLGPMAMIEAVWPVFERQREGCVVNISSMATIDPFPSLFAYAAAKGAVNVMAKSIANQAKARGLSGVRAYAVAPGAVETEMLRSIVSEEMLPKSQTLTPEAVAAVVVECVTGRTGAASGETIPVPSGQ